MNLVPAGIQLSFEVTYDSPSLYVGMSIYDDSGLFPILISGPTLMANVIGNTYRGKFTPDINTTYVIFKAVYTDNTLTVLSSAYSQASETIVCEQIANTGAAGNSDIIGFIENNNPIIGLVVC